MGTVSVSSTTACMLQFPPLLECDGEYFLHYVLLHTKCFFKKLWIIQWEAAEEEGKRPTWRVSGGASVQKLLCAKLTLGPHHSRRAVQRPRDTACEGNESPTSCWNYYLNAPGHFYLLLFRPADCSHDLHLTTTRMIIRMGTAIQLDGNDDTKLTAGLSCHQGSTIKRPVSHNLAT